MIRRSSRRGLASTRKSLRSTATALRVGGFVEERPECRPAKVGNRPDVRGVPARIQIVPLAALSYWSQAVSNSRSVIARNALSTPLRESTVLKAASLGAPDDDGSERRADAAFRR